MGPVYVSVFNVHWSYGLLICNVVVNKVINSIKYVHRYYPMKTTGTENEGSKYDSKNIIEEFQTDLKTLLE